MRQFGVSQDDCEGLAYRLCSEGRRTAKMADKSNKTTNVKPLLTFAAQ